MTDAALRDAARRLAAVSDTPRLDAELLLAYALGISRERLLLGGVPAAVPPGFAALVERRLGHEPIAYITGTRAFWTIDLAVGPGVLVPRPDSETLLTTALAHFGDAGPATVLDLGTGSGALLLAALDQWTAARGLGVDRSDAALAIARGNAERLGLAARARFVWGDWAAGVDGCFDLVLCNPPYVEDDAVLPADVRLYEPASALFAGNDGLADYRRLMPQIARLIAPGGIAAIEIGATQAAAVSALATGMNLRVSCHRDLAGRDRCLVVSQ